MKIVKIDTFVVEIPFKDGGKGQGITPTTWNTLENVLIRLQDEQGNIGWGEAFGYFVADASKALIDRLITPLLLDREVHDIAQWNRDTQLRLHLFGRYGVTMFAISGVDMALWDLAARRQQQPLHRLLGTASREQVPAYASMVRYADNEIAPRICEKALEMGFRDIKLHEVTVDEIAACRRAIGDDVPLATDVNCSWSVQDTRDWLPALADLKLVWLEEPIFPPEDFATLASFRGNGVPLSAGENWCTAVQFEQALKHGAVDSIQPSVTKVGGISECLRIAELAQAYGAVVLPHCPYFGPGLLATLHLAAVQPTVPQIEYLFVEPAGWLYDIEGLRDGHLLQIPQQAGLGQDIDLGVLERFRRA
ncbi:mandelate racemase/muconate lactonizing enzyme family protein [Pseudomonas sp. 13B_2.1_Bac1]|uniref:mandelate racemase/muconate lactonizing enzyme family protein n=1 Tax=Pseudomonas sp. 13B_2.1_Bac1 TaxID=2971624 RepID=UPI0021C89508|nr:mandelate racemase/muconate lactonizing enzyme family protein [Pseudomonas sp. 13B_2.1_Bac1]MCU1785313.1 mandelate racemase/muconate lactonizing enzyme family protein [Pseudomonas sp. 13B_2.1_Bac1]